jgi:heterodisulfide reductase subunit A
VILKYEETGSGEIKKSEYDIVILSVGIGPRPDSQSVAEAFGVELDPVGFMKPCSALTPYLSGKDGVFLAGACTGPGDIRDSMAQGRAAARAALDWIQGREG